jgi:hypothetical protein
MKKKMSLLLCVLCAAAAFADGPVNVTLDAVADAFYMRMFTGDYTRKDYGSSIYHYQGAGSIKSFQSSMFDDAVKGRVGLSLQGERLGGSLQLRMDVDTSYAKKWDWSLWLKPLDFLKVAAGNTAQYGDIQRYSNFDGFLKTNIGGLGVLFPTWRSNAPYVQGNNFDDTSTFPYGYPNAADEYGFVSFNGTETYDLFMPAGSFERSVLNVGAAVQFEPVTITAAAGGLFDRNSVPAISVFKLAEVTDLRTQTYDIYGDPAVNGGMHFGVRAEGAKIADMVTIAAVYKLTTTQLTKDKLKTGADEKELIDERTANHTFGLYATLTPLAGLGITAGYSGLYQTWENPFADKTVIESENFTHLRSQYKEAALPLYHGIDLRFCFTGVEKLTVTFNNNVSMASITGKSQADNDKLLYAEGWAYTGMLNTQTQTGSGDASGRSENYFGLFNALGLRYAATDTLNIEVSVANQIGLFTLQGWDTQLTSTTDYLGAYAGLECTIIDVAGIKGSIRGGFDLRMASFDYQSVADKDGTAGYIDIGVPISLKVMY